MLVKVSNTKYRTVLNSSRKTLQIATSGGHEIVAVIITGGSGGAAVRISDSNNGTVALNSFLIAANGGESTTFQPTSPILMTNGIYADLEQYTGNAEATIFYN